MCRSPLSPNFGTSVTNWIHWYSETDPQPRVVERLGRPFEVRLRDPKGIEFGIKFERTPLDLNGLLNKKGLDVGYSADAGFAE